MIRTKADLRSYLEQDCKALGIKRLSLKGRIQEWLFPNQIWKFERLLRYTEYYSNNQANIMGGVKYLFYKARFRKLSMKLGFSIPTNVFGPGLSIAHYGTIVVNGNTRVGANCRIHASVNIGASAGKQEAPTIGDNVYIGPGAILFGNITIADNVTVAANATVNRSCDTQYCVLAGTPAKVVKEDAPNWLQFNKVGL